MIEISHDEGIPFWRCRDCKWWSKLPMTSKCPCFDYHWICPARDPAAVFGGFTSHWQGYTNGSHRICAAFQPTHDQQFWDGFDFYYNHYCPEAGRHVIIHPITPLGIHRSGVDDVFIVPEIDFVECKIIKGDRIRYLHHYEPRTTFTKTKAEMISSQHGGEIILGKDFQRFEWDYYENRSPEEENGYG